MKVEVASELLAHPRERVWALLQDPSALARLLPGVERLEPVGPDRYAIEVKLGVGAVRGTYTGKVELTDQRPPESYRLVGEAKGGPGFAKGSAVLTLVEEAGGTRVVARGDAQVGGPVASVGQRLLEGVAKGMAREFFAALDRELAGRGAAKTSVSGFGLRVLWGALRRFFARLLGRRRP